MDWDAFFKLHADLPREGPGAPEDVDWALGQAGLPADAVICDAGSGPGGDVPALLDYASQVVAVDSHAPFIDTLNARFADDPRVTGHTGDMAALADLPQAPFDAIWCAGALYFLGVEAGLTLFRPALKPRGVVAFSYPCWFVDAPSQAAQDFWQGFDGVRSPDQIRAETQAAGFQVLADRPVADAAWEAYFQPLEWRIAALRPEADAAMSAVLDENTAEIDTWRQVRDQTGYHLVVARLA